MNWVWRLRTLTGGGLGSAIDRLLSAATVLPHYPEPLALCSMPHFNTSYAADEPTIFAPRARKNLRTAYKDTKRLPSGPLGFAHIGREALLSPGYFLPAYKHPTFTDRLTHAAGAKAAIIDRYRSRPRPDDPRVVALAEERMRLHVGRLARQAERQRIKDEERARELEAQRLKEEQEIEAELARQAQSEADGLAAQLARRERLAANAANSADQKALRDARYSARKARQKR